jgi:hypothetical protein
MRMALRQLPCHGLQWNWSVIYQQLTIYNKAERVRKDRVNRCLDDMMMDLVCASIATVEYLCGMKRAADNEKWRFRRFCVWSGFKTAYCVETML